MVRRLRGNQPTFVLDKKMKRHENVIYGFDDDVSDRVQQDYAQLMDTVHLATTERVRQLLLMQSEQGRAIMGAGAFTETNEVTKHVFRYVNMTIDHVLRYLMPRRDIPAVKQERQAIIDGISWWVDQAIDELQDRKNGCESGTPQSYMLLDEHNEPLGGIEYFRHNPISHPLRVLQGMYLGSCMDNFQWRERVTERHGIVLGGGESYAVHMPTLTAWADRERENKKTLRYCLELLAQKEHTDEDVDRWEQRGVLTRDETKASNDGWMQGYVRRKIGLGVSDDAALLTAGILLGGTVEERVEAALGLLLIDAVDTWDKCTPVIYAQGQDELLGQSIRQRLGPQLGLGSPSDIDEFVLKFIYASAINPKKKTLYPDCSQRRFLEYHPGKRFLYTLAAHIHYLKTWDPEDPHQARANLPDLSISFGRVSMRRFMHEYLGRLQELQVLSPNGHA